MAKSAEYLAGKRKNSGFGSQAEAARADEFTPDEADAVEYYISGDGMFINQMLRRGETLEGEDAELVKDLDSATNKALPQGTLYRSVDAAAIFPDITDLEYENLVQAVVYGDNQRLVRQSADRAMGRMVADVKEPGYMSTTSEYGVAADWGGFSGSEKPVVLEIQTTRKTRGADVSSIGDRYAEDGDRQYEVLLRRGQSYHVESVGARDGNLYIKVRMT